jgi:eukaryotic-like serine/threonine-protein kinase
MARGMDRSNFANIFPSLTAIEELASGGYKTVYKAVHNNHGDVVLKIIKPSKDKPESLERIKREIRSSEIIESDHIPRIFASDISGEDIWIIEEYINGETLRDVINSKKSFSLSEIFGFLETMLSIIIKAEQKRIVHRDIKPENIIIDTTGKIWLIDFGIARHLDLVSLTNSNAPFAPCTIGYASAEQFRNRKREIDSRTDLFAIGVVAYEMISGENFYIKDARDVFQVIRKIERDPLPAIKITGDPQYLLANFIKTIGDNRLSRRPSSAQEAFDILRTIRPTLSF